MAPKLQSLALRLSSDCTTWRRIVLQEDCPPVPIVPIVLQEDCHPVSIVPIVPIVLQEVCPRIAPPGGARLLPKNTHNICFSLHYIGGSVDPILWCTVMLNVDSAEPVKSMI